MRLPYVDAMALFDRRALLDVDGYSTDHPWMGWEDYDLWLKLAAAGKRIALVPEVLTSYRVHPASMIHDTNRHTLSWPRSWRPSSRGWPPATRISRRSSASRGRFSRR